MEVPLKSGMSLNSKRMRHSKDSASSSTEQVPSSKGGVIGPRTPRGNQGSREKSRVVIVYQLWVAISLPLGSITSAK